MSYGSSNPPNLKKKDDKKKRNQPYTPVIKHSNGKSPFSIGNTSSKGPFSIAMLDYRSVNLLSE